MIVIVYAYVETGSLLKAFETVQCKGGNFSCSEGVVSAYKKNLENGFLLANRCLGGLLGHFMFIVLPLTLSKDRPRTLLLCLKCFLLPDSL